MSDLELGVISPLGRHKNVFPNTSEPRKAPVYKIDVRDASYDGKPYLYFVGIRLMNVVDVEGLPAEIFSTDLQKVDTLDVDSLLDFAEHYGAIPSPALAGAESHLAFRNRSVERPYHAPNIDMLMQAATDTAFLGYLNKPTSLFSTLTDEYKEDMPRRLTEHARSIEADDPNSLEVISVPELSQAIRALQCASAVASVYDFMCLPDSEGTAVSMTEYITDERRVQQSGFGYFLHSDDIIVNGFVPMGFDERLEKSPSFRAMVENTETNARAGYNIALADVYNVNSLDALSYLMLANAAYSNAGEPSYAHAKDETGIDDPLKQKVEMSDSRLISPSTEYGCLGEIVTAQFARCYASPTPWRRCAFCNRVFKQYREEKFTKKGIRETKFCKKSCNVMYIQNSKRV